MNISKVIEVCKSLELSGDNIKLRALCIFLIEKLKFLNLYLAFSQQIFISVRRSTKKSFNFIVLNKKYRIFLYFVKNMCAFSFQN